MIEHIFINHQSYLYIAFHKSFFHSFSFDIIFKKMTLYNSNGYRQSREYKRYLAIFIRPYPWNGHKKVQIPSSKWKPLINNRYLQPTALTKTQQRTLQLYLRYNQEQYIVKNDLIDQITKSVINKLIFLGWNLNRVRLETSRHEIVKMLGLIMFKSCILRSWPQVCHDITIGRPIFKSIQFLRYQDNLIF